MFSSTLDIEKTLYLIGITRLNLTCKFTNGYAYPNTEKSISKPFAPAYVFIGLGAEYASKKKDELLYLSPLP
jgi:hypothetical protein